MALYNFKEHKPEIGSSVFIAPNASLIGEVHMADNSSLWFSAVIRADTAPIYVGEKTNVQDLSVLHADPGFPLTLGKNITIGHRAIVHGCTIEDDCLIGMGSIVMNGAKIGRGCIIAAGAVVLENAEIPAFSLVAGTPGKVIRKFDEDIIPVIRMSSDYYSEKALYYLSEDFKEIKIP